MKKLITVLFALLLLVGCTSKGYSQLSNGDEVIFKGPESEYTRNDLYRSLKLASSDEVETDIINKIAELEGIDTTAIEEEADSIISMYEEMGYAYYLTYYYGSTEAYKEQYISDGILLELSKSYVTVKFDELVAEDKPVKMQLASFDSEEAANQLLSDVNAGSTFDMAAANNGYESDASEQIYLDTDSNLNLDVKQYLNETETTGLSSIIVSTSTSTDADGNATETNTYYVLNIISRDTTELKDEYITLKADEVESDDVKNYYFEIHDVEFYDQDIYEMMIANYEVLQ